MKIEKDWYVVQNTPEGLQFYQAFTDDYALYSKYVQQMNKVNTKVIGVIEHNTTREAIMKKYKLNAQMQIKPFLSYDGSVMLVLTDRFKDSIRYLLPDGYLEGKFSNYEDAIAWITCVLDYFPSIRKSIGNDTKLAYLGQSLLTMRQYLFATATEGLASGVIDDIKLISNMWGW